MRNPALTPIAPSEPNNRFTWRPIRISAALWLLAILPLALSDLGGPLPNIWQFLDAVAIILAFGVYAVACLALPILRRWKRASTWTVSLVALGLATSVTFHYRDDLKFHVARLSILAELALPPRTGDTPRHSVRDFTDGNSPSWALLEYDETDRDAPESGQVERTWTSYEWRRDGCRVTVRPLAHRHFFLKTVDCPD
jgi:hypothetical protein